MYYIIQPKHSGKFVKRTYATLNFYVRPLHSWKMFFTYFMYETIILAAYTTAAYKVVTSEFRVPSVIARIYNIVKC